MTSKEALERVLQIKRYNRSRIPACSTIRIFSDEKEAEETLENAINRLEELEQVAIKGFNPNTDEYEYGQLFYSKENGYELKNKNGDLLTNVMIQKSNDDYFKMKNVLKIIKKIIKYDEEVNGNKIDDVEYKQNNILTETEFNLLKEYLK